MVIKFDIFWGNGLLHNYTSTDRRIGVCTNIIRNKNVEITLKIELMNIIVFFLKLYPRFLL